MTRPYRKNIPNTQFFAFKTKDSKRFMVAIAHTVLMVLDGIREVWRTSSPFRDDVIPQVKVAYTDDGMVLVHHSCDPVLLSYPWNLKVMKERENG